MLMQPSRAPVSLRKTIVVPSVFQLTYSKCCLRGWAVLLVPGCASRVAEAVSIEKQNECPPQSQDDQCSGKSHGVPPSPPQQCASARSVVGAPRLFSSIVRARNEIPAGAKPSGLPASVQEARVNV